VVVRLLAGVTDTIRHRLLVERASQVFGVAEEVIARAARLASGGDRTGQPMAAAVHAQRRVESAVECELLTGLWHAPELLDSARAELGPEDFSDEGTRALAQVWWQHGVIMPAGDVHGEAAAGLARELATSGQDGFNYPAVVVGAIRNLVVRRLKHDLRRRREKFATALGEKCSTCNVRSRKSLSGWKN